jgi:hypothetical protein
VVVVALVCGLLGAVALGALSGARRTESAYGRYLESVNSSDVFVNIPAPVVTPIAQIEHLPEVRSGAAWLGLNASPVIGGRVDQSFLAPNLAGSLDGEYFRQDRMTVLAGRLPRPGATDEIVLSQSTARFFGVSVGGHVTWQFSGYSSLNASRAMPAGRRTFLVTGIVDIPPVLVDQFDQVESAVLPPAAVLSLALASVRQRRRELALLKTLGFSRRQVRAVIAWQASLILIIAALAGVPLGLAAGRWAWTSFASSIGGVPVTSVPVLTLILGFVGLLAAGNLLTAAPAIVAARTAPASALRAE